MDYLSVARYNPEVEHASSIAASFDTFDNSSLSETTHIDRVTYQSHLPRRKSQLKSTAEIQALRDYEDLTPAHEFFFIYKYLVHNPAQGVPADANKLRISRSSFEALATRLRLPPAFVFALSRHYLPNGRGSRKLQLSDGSVAFDHWYFLPVRVQVKATSPQIKDAVAEGDGSEWPNQMNPFHRLHLPAVKLNILRSCVAIFSRVHPNTKKVTFMAVDFMHGRWPSVAMEPQQRIDEAMQRAIQDIEGPGCFPDLVYLSSAVRWWTNALNSVNEQLIAYELRLQTTRLRGPGWETIASETEFANINPALHSIAAHLHRYLSELKSLRCIAVNLLSHYKCVHTDKPTDEDPVKYDDDASRSISQLLSHIEATEDFANELEKKTQNILALLFNRIQIDNAKASHALAEEMKRDSIAMRAIAIVTMFFLPGATFAALLAMPFFSEDGWFSDVSKLWIWVVLTVPSTCACFAFYKIWRVRARRELVYTEGIPLGAMP